MTIAISRWRFMLRAHAPVVWISAMLKSWPHQPEWLPRHDSKIFITSWGRSANSYPFWIIRELMDDRCHVASHGHSVGSLKIAKKHKVKILLILRRPDATVASMLSKKDFSDEFLIELLDDWTNYHRWVLKNLSVCSVVLFEDFLTDPCGTVAAINLSDFDFKRTIPAAQAAALHRLRSDSRPESVRNLSTEERKNKLGAIADKVRLLQGYPESLDLYNSLCKKVVEAK